MVRVRASFLPPNGTGLQTLHTLKGTGLVDPPTPHTHTHNTTTPTRHTAPGRPTPRIKRHGFPQPPPH